MKCCVCECEVAEGQEGTQGFLDESDKLYVTCSRRECNIAFGFAWEVVAGSDDLHLWAFRQEVAGVACVSQPVAAVERHQHKRSGPGGLQIDGD